MPCEEEVQEGGGGGADGERGVMGGGRGGREGGGEEAGEDGGSELVQLGSGVRRCRYRWRGKNARRAR